MPGDLLLRRREYLVMVLMRENLMVTLGISPPFHLKHNQTARDIRNKGEREGIKEIPPMRVLVPS